MLLLMRLSSLRFRTSLNSSPRTPYNCSATRDSHPKSLIMRMTEIASKRLVYVLSGFRGL